MKSRANPAQAYQPLHVPGDLPERKLAEEARRAAHENLRAQAKQLQTLNEMLSARQKELETANGDLRVQEEELRSQGEALRESEQRYRTLFETAPDAIVVHKDGRFLDANEATLYLTGASTYEELANHTVLDFFRPEDCEQAVERMRQAMAGCRLPMREATLRRLDGREAVVEFHTAPVDFQGGQAVQTIIRDITERKRAEEELRRSEERFRVAQELSLDAFTILAAVRDDSGRIIDFRWEYVNPEAGRILRHPPAELVGQRLLAVLPGSRANSDLFDRYVRVVETGHPHDYELCYESEGIRGWFRNMTVKLGDGIAICFTDITERRRTEEALRELNATLESKVAQRTAELTRRAQQLQKLTLELTQAEERERRRIALFLHEDLQQQIAGAKFHLSLMRSRAQEDRQRADVDTVDAMLKEAIEQSRRLSRDLSPAVLHMNDLAEVLQWLANRVRAQDGLSVKLEVSGDLVLHSEALATFLFRAAQEMLSNTVKHAQIREAAIRVRRIGRCVCLSVSDEGRGFNPQALEETSGVGLFSIRERVELLGGRMTVKSAVGKGSRLTIIVPDGRKSEDRGQKTEDGQRTGEERLLFSVLCPPSSARVLRVLLVDDHNAFRHSLAAMLGAASGIEVIGATAEGREAIKMAMDLHPDVVVMDVSMPNMSGDEVTQQIKTHLPQTRVIALSMYDEAEKREKMFEAGAERYLLKTVSAEELLAALRGPDS
jgi:PAS domain S-box-containing protein